METNQLDDELSRIGYVPDYPPKTINGVPLTDNQHEAYISLAGSTSKNMLNSLINSDGWSKIPDSTKPQIVKGVIQQARANAQSVVMTHSIGTHNDIMKQSLINKRQPQ